MIKGSNEHLDQIDGQLSTLAELTAAHAEKLSKMEAPSNITDALSLEERVTALENQFQALDKALVTPPWNGSPNAAAAATVPA